MLRRCLKTNGGITMKYKMISEYGNETAYAEDEATKARLESLGFREEKTTHSHRKSVGKNETENTDRT